MRIILALVFALCTFQMAGAEESAADIEARIAALKAHTAAIEAETLAMRKEVWYDALYAKPRPTTFRAALAAEKEFLAGNPYWKEVNAPGLVKVCKALHDVQVACDYNTRGTITMFLAFYGKSLFPAAGGTNPYFTAADRERELARGDADPDNVFIGHPPQNDMLAAAVRKNAALFKNGDISAETVKKFWK